MPTQPRRSHLLNPADREKLMEVLAVGAAIAHLLRFTDPARNARADEIAQHLLDVGLEHEITFEDIFGSYRSWFNELAMYFGASVTIPEGDAHFSDPSTTYRTPYQLGLMYYSEDDEPTLP